MIYLDHASTSRPKPAEVIEEISSYLREIGASPGRGGYALAHSAYELLQGVRAKLAALLNVQKIDQISFTHNATHAINIVLKGLLKEKDHVIISNFEHNSVLRPLHKLSNEGRISYSVWHSDLDGYFEPEALERLIRPNTKLIVLNHASNVLGVLSPVREVGRIANRANIPILVDVAQTAGLFPVDFGDFADYIAGTGHKSLLGPPGVGFLYVKNPDTLDTLYEGGSGEHSLSPFHPEIAPDKFEAGTANYVGIAGLKGSLSFLESYGQDRMRQEVMDLTARAIDCIRQVPGAMLYGTQSMEHKVPLLSFNIKGSFAGEIGYALNQHGISVRCGLHCAPLMHKTLGTIPQGTVRLSLGHRNTIAEIERFCDLLTHLTQKDRCSGSKREDEMQRKIRSPT